VKIQVVPISKPFISVIKSRFVNAVKRFSFRLSVSFHHYCMLVIIDMLLSPGTQMAKPGKLQGTMLSQKLGSTGENSALTSV